MVSVLDDYLNQAGSNSEKSDAEDYSNISTLQSMVAGVGSGLIAIPKGFASLAASVMDLGVNSGKAAEVEQWFDDLTSLDEMAEATTAGKITEALVNIGVPAVGAYSKAASIASSVIKARGAGTYFTLTNPNLVKGVNEAVKLNKKGRGAQFFAGSTAGGFAEGVFVGDVEQVGTFGDLLGGPTELVRDDEDDATKEIMNRVKFGTEGALFNGLIGGVGSTIKKLATRGKDLRFANNKMDRLIDKFASGLRARSGKTQEFFDLERKQVGLRSVDANVAKQTARELDKNIDAIFPAWKTIADQTFGTERKKALEAINDALLSGKPIINDAGEVVFSKIDDTAKTKVLDVLKKVGADEKNYNAIFDNIDLMRNGWGDMFSALGKSMKGKEIIEFKNLFGNKFKDWMGTTYEAFEKKSLIPFFNYKPTAEAITETRKMFMETAEAAKKPITEEQADFYIERLLKESNLPKLALNRETDVVVKLPGFMQKNILDDAISNRGNVSLSALPDAQKRTIEKLLGKGKDPFATILAGTARLSLISRRNQFFKDILTESDKLGVAGKTDNNVRGMFYDDYEEAIAKLGPDARQVNIDPSKTLEAGVTNPLNGKYAIPEIADALEEVNKELIKGVPGQIYNGLILYPKAASQVAKTILSPVTHVRNFFSAGAFATANGIIPDVQAIKESYQALQIPFKGARQANERYRRLLELGVVNSNVRLGDLQGLMKDISVNGFNFDSGLKSILKPFSKFKSFSEDLYTAEDDFWKMASFSTESRRLGKAYEKAGIKKTIIELEEEAADIVRNNIPNYDYVSDFVKNLRRFPLGNFVSFPAEIMRTGGNIVQRALKEINTSVVNDAGQTVKPLVGIGYRRLIGMGLTTTAIPAGTVAAAKAIYNVSEDEINAMRRYVADWSKNSTIVPIRDKETNDLKYIDFSHANAYDTLTRPFQTVLNAVAAGQQDEDGIMDDMLRGMVTSVGELAQPFVSESIWTEAVLDLVARKGRTREGFQVYNETEALGDKSTKMIKHLTEALMPLSLPTLNRIVKAGRAKIDPDDPKRFSERGEEYKLGNEMLSFLGARVVPINTERTFNYKVADFQRGARESKSLFTRNVLKGGIVTPEQITEAYLNANRALFNVKKNFSKDMEAGKILGLSEEKMYNVFDVRNISRKERFALEEGIYRPFEISDSVKEAFEVNAAKLGVPNPFNQVESVLDNIYDVLSVAPLSLNAFPEMKNPFSTPQEELPVSSAITNLEQVNAQLLQPVTTGTTGTIPYSQMNLAQRAEYDKLVRGI